MRIAGNTGTRRAHLRRITAAMLSTAALLLTALVGAANAAPATQGPNPYWHKVRLHGHTILVHRHGRYGVVPNRHRRLLPQAGSNLLYNGGPVAHSPAIYLDFWGNQWDSDANGVSQYLQSYFGGLGQSGDSWSTITSQYTDSSGQGPSFNGSVLGGVWTDDNGPAPASASADQLAAEAVTAAQHFNVSGDDVDIFVVSPSGTSPDGFPNTGFCAWHDFTQSSSGSIPYTNMPYVLDAGSGCGANSVQNQLDGFSIVGGHEYAEAITDPEPSSGWVDSSGQEIGDKCAWQNLSALNLSTGSFAVQPLWDNNSSGCLLSTGG